MLFMFVFLFEAESIRGLELIRGLGFRLRFRLGFRL